MTDIIQPAPRIRVELGGVLGKKFGKVWHVCAATARDALNIISANRADLTPWLRNHATKYSHYHLRLERPDGSVHDVSEDEYLMASNGAISTLRVTPKIQGAGGKVMGAIQTVVGAALIVAGLMAPAVSWGLVAAGVGMLMGGVASLLTKTPKTPSGSKNDNVDSFYFNGPENTISQGNPVPLIYGEEILVGSQAISSRISIDQLM